MSENFYDENNRPSIEAQARELVARVEAKKGKPLRPVSPRALAVAKKAIEQIKALGLTKEQMRQSVRNQRLRGVMAYIKHQEAKRLKDCENE